MNAVIIGYGNRAKKVWEPALKGMDITLLAIVDPSPISDFKFKVYKNIEEISNFTREIDFAIVCTPPEAHFKVSKSLIDYGINHIIETPFCLNIQNAKQIEKLSIKNNVKVAIAENFVFKIEDKIISNFNGSNLLGKLKRVSCFYDHPGFHNNSRWLKLFNTKPIESYYYENNIKVPSFYDNNNKENSSEKFTLDIIKFKNGEVFDLSGNFKGGLGRLKRPGILIADYEMGSIIFNNPTKSNIFQKFKFFIFDKLGIRYSVFSDIEIINSRKNINSSKKSTYLKVKYHKRNWTEYYNNKLKFSILNERYNKNNLKVYQKWVKFSVYSFLTNYKDHIINSKELFFTLSDSIQVLKLTLNKNKIKKD